ncbi:MAG: hypothetical protein JW829_06000 [Pirellulales bacterium]|nr:hypothetical protein [Pirellulales bacterium]
MTRTRFWQVARQIPSLAIALFVVGNSAAFAEGTGHSRDPFSAIFGGVLPASTGTSYAGQVFNPLTSRGRAGSVMPAIREARLHRTSEIAYGPEMANQDEPGPTHETVITPIPDGSVEYESDPIFSGPDCDCDGGLEPCDECGLDPCSDPCTGCFPGLGSEWDICGGADECIPLCLPRFQYLAIFAGVHGFKGPRDTGWGNNFGFQEGVQVGGRAPLLPWPHIGYQLGYQTTQSRLHGDLATLSETSRNQHLATAGIYHRRKVGLQWGVVYDLMRDDLVQDLDFSQIRAEMSLVGPRGGEIGVWTAIHTNDSGYENIFGEQYRTTLNFRAVDQYVLFYRWHFFDCGEARLWGGMTDNNDGLFGGDFLLPIDDRWSLQGGFNYLIPEEDVLPDSAIRESWNIGINLVWHFGCNGCTSHSSPYRPLFNVVDNGTMLIDQIHP